MPRSFSWRVAPLQWLDLANGLMVKQDEHVYFLIKSKQSLKERNWFEMKFIFICTDFEPRSPKFSRHTFFQLCIFHWSEKKRR